MRLIHELSLPGRYRVFGTVTALLSNSGQSALLDIVTDPAMATVVLALPSPLGDVDGQLALRAVLLRCKPKAGGTQYHTSDTAAYLTCAVGNHPPSCVAAAERPPLFFSHGSAHSLTLPIHLFRAQAVFAEPVRARPAGGGAGGAAHRARGARARAAAAAGAPHRGAAGEVHRAPDEAGGPGRCDALPASAAAASRRAPDAQRPPAAQATCTLWWTPAPPCLGAMRAAPRRRPRTSPRPKPPSRRVLLRLAASPWG